MDFSKEIDKIHKKVNIDTFHRHPVTSPEIIIGTEKKPISGIFSNYDDDDCTQGYGQVKEAYRALTKDDILKPYILDDDFISFKEGNSFGLYLYIFDIRYQKNIKSAQPIKLK